MSKTFSKTSLIFVFVYIKIGLIYSVYNYYFRNKFFIMLLKILININVTKIA